ncbi:uncharacterized protein B0J16DRAFT_333803 [Fusarium flagelliforme]|uniref:uncharacterized protein n=1 Tax=Fusarium flagelliforme TaxID=2675880 RepID=UPI001E8E07BE|nr:uncharacterized protein B0J16DRAFT_333803 [Fusarium flagelliforme]KAH7192833.1 hypothetical protein B0J16DRAFT_333803 [Fusarium flagelliforme]
MGVRKRSRSESQRQVQDHPFQITYPKTIPKPTVKDGRAVRRRVRMQSFPFTCSGTHSLDLLHSVKPTDTWYNMTSYKSFVLSGVKHKLGDFIFLANEQTIKRRKVDEDQTPQEDEEWVARVLEVRAKDANHVYARVHWMYRPEELPPGTLDGDKKIQGRQPYHGEKELIMSNHMDIVDVLSVSGPAEVKCWGGEEEDKETPEGLFWHQAFDWRSSRLLSLDRICMCRSQPNPEKALALCTNPVCIADQKKVVET